MRLILAFTYPCPDYLVSFVFSYSSYMGTTFTLQMDTRSRRTSELAPIQCARDVFIKLPKQSLQ